MKNLTEIIKEYPIPKNVSLADIGFMAVIRSLSKEQIDWLIEHSDEFSKLKTETQR